MEILRYDRGEVKQKHYTDEGFLDVEAVFTRTGVFNYMNADGTIRRELRHPQDVFRDDSLKSMGMLPITLLHPKERVVDSENAKKLGVGFTGENIYHDGRLIGGKAKITNKDAVAAVEDGIQELSLGYKVNLIKEDGVFQGEKYDHRQTDIKYNHLAIVPRGRAGEAKIILDHADAVQQPETEPNHKKRSQPMTVKVNIDGIEYDAAPEVKNSLTKATARADEATAKVTSLTEENTKLQANFDAQKEELEKLKKVDHSDEIQKAVKARSDLVTNAMKHLDAEEVKDLESKTDAEIKLMVIKKHSPDFKEDGKDEAYIQARFDVALEKEPKKNADGIQKQRQQANGGRGDSNDEPDSEKARDDYKDELKNAWKTKKPEAAKA